MIENKQNNPFVCNSSYDKTIKMLRYLIANDIGLSIILIIVSYGNVDFK
jgi:hypothetical protein